MANSTGFRATGLEIERVNSIKAIVVVPKAGGNRRWARDGAGLQGGGRSGPGRVGGPPNCAAGQAGAGGGLGSMRRVPSTSSKLSYGRGVGKKSRFFPRPFWYERGRNDRRGRGRVATTLLRSYVGAPANCAAGQAGAGGVVGWASVRRDTSRTDVKRRDAGACVAKRLRVPRVGKLRLVGRARDYAPAELRRGRQAQGRAG